MLLLVVYFYVTGFIYIVVDPVGPIIRMVQNVIVHMKENYLEKHKIQVAIFKL